MPDIRIMNAADIPLGMRLKEQASWNQTEADWQRYLELQPDGCFVASLDGEAVATLTTCVFGPVAWIAMVLVDLRSRRRGRRRGPPAPRSGVSRSSRGAYHPARRHGAGPAALREAGFRGRVHVTSL